MYIYKCIMLCTCDGVGARERERKRDSEREMLLRLLGGSWLPRSMVFKRATILVTLLRGKQNPTYSHKIIFQATSGS